jgi:hypothetical protein
MADFTTDTRYAPLSSPPTNSTFQLGTEMAEMESIPIDDRHANSSRSLLRRESITSLVSSTSSEMGARRGPILRQAFHAVSEVITQLETKVQERMRHSRYYGWRMGIVFGSTMSALVLCCNIIVIVVASSLGTKRSDNFVDIMQGDDVSISRWSTAFHIMINLFSTILLAASNYTMQVLCSPTRSDLDAAHGQGHWLDIGLLSLRNLRYLPRGRIALGLLLAFSSIPLHLL